MPFVSDQSTRRRPADMQQGPGQLQKTRARRVGTIPVPSVNRTEALDPI
jgi:hypothetical protein